MSESLRDLGYTVGWSQGATPDELRDKHREAGWVWEGDSHTSDGEAIQHDDPNAAGYVPAHRVLADDSEQPTIWHVSWPIGAEHSDGTPIPVALTIYVRDDDEDTLRSLLESHGERQAELELLMSETPEEADRRHGGA